MAGFFTGAGGGLLGGLFGLAGAGIDAANSNKQQERQMAHDKDMAALNQQNQLEQMSVQNQYQIDQWNRENEYNDPSAVAARYRDAGINPRAAFGQGSASGAGIAGGLSSAPSGSNTGTSSNVMFGTKFAGLGDAVLAGARLQAQNKKDSADADKAYVEAKNTAMDVKYKQFREINGAWLAEIENTKAKADTEKAIAEMRKFDSFMYDVEHSADVSKKVTESRNAIQTGRNLVAQYDNIISDTSLKDATRDKVNEEKNKVIEEVRNLKLRNDFYLESGFFPDQSFVTSLMTGGAKTVKGHWINSFINLTPKLFDPTKNVLSGLWDSGLGNFIKSAKGKYDKLFQKYVIDSPKPSLKGFKEYMLKTHRENMKIRKSNK